MKKILLTIFLVMATLAPAQLPSLSVSIDLNRRSRTFELILPSGSIQEIDVYLLVDGVDFTTVDANWDISLGYSDGAGSDSWVDEIEGAYVSANMLTLAPTELQTTGSGVFFAQIMVTDSNGDILEWARGTLELLPNPSQ